MLSWSSVKAALINNLQNSVQFCSLPLPGLLCDDCHAWSGHEIHDMGCRDRDHRAPVRGSAPGLKLGSSVLPRWRADQDAAAVFLQRRLLIRHGLARAEAGSGLDWGGRSIAARDLRERQADGPSAFAS